MCPRSSIWPQRVVCREVQENVCKSLLHVQSFARGVWPPRRRRPLGAPTCRFTRVQTPLGWLPSRRGCACTGRLPLCFGRLLVYQNEDHPRAAWGQADLLIDCVRVASFRFVVVCGDFKTTLIKLTWCGVTFTASVIAAGLEDLQPMGWETAHLLHFFLFPSDACTSHLRVLP